MKRSHVKLVIDRLEARKAAIDLAIEELRADPGYHDGAVVAAAPEAAAVPPAPRRRRVNGPAEEAPTS